jgi:hypothetical protein
MSSYNIIIGWVCLCECVRVSERGTFILYYIFASINNQVCNMFVCVLNVCVP